MRLRIFILLQQVREVGIGCLTDTAIRSNEVVPSTMCTVQMIVEPLDPLPQPTFFPSLPCSTMRMKWLDSSSSHNTTLSTIARNSGEISRSSPCAISAVRLILVGFNGLTRLFHLQQ